MKKLFISLSVLILSLFSLSCSVSTHDFPRQARQSFLKVEKKVEVAVCEGGVCTTKYGLATGSGAVVDKNSTGAYVLTAGHVCLVDSYITKGVKLIDVKMDVLDLGLKRYRADIIHIDMEIDTCLMYVAGLHRPVLDMAFRNPKQGDKSFNIAAPVGIFNKNLVPLMEGYFIGNEGRRALYSIPAAGGSSGSPILNHHGQLIGMIHSVNLYFPVITVSTTTDDLRKFIWEAIKKHEWSIVEKALAEDDVSTLPAELIQD